MPALKRHGLTAALLLMGACSRTPDVALDELLGSVGPLDDEDERDETLAAEAAGHVRGP